MPDSSLVPSAPLIYLRPRLSDHLHFLQFLLPLPLFILPYEPGFQPNSSHGRPHIPTYPGRMLGLSPHPMSVLRVTLNTYALFLRNMTITCLVDFNLFR